MTTLLRRSALALPLLLAACRREGLLDPQGPVAAAEQLILINATAIMLVVAGPVIILTLAFAWWFRASNKRAFYWPDWEYSGQIELTVWAIPAMVVILLAGVGWIGSHQLDPKLKLAGTASPIRVQVVALDWKWLFIYPDQHVAAVNRLVLPAGAPVEFTLTSASVMNSFFVPELGSQIYAMGGMTTHLNLKADAPGDYPGFSAQFSGDGFADMRFTVHAVPADQFADWVGQTQEKGMLDMCGYADLAKPGTADAGQVFGKVEPALFEAIIKQVTETATPNSCAGEGAG